MTTKQIIILVGNILIAAAVFVAFGYGKLNSVQVGAILAALGFPNVMMAFKKDDAESTSSSSSSDSAPKPPSMLGILVVVFFELATTTTNTGCSGDVVAQRAKNAIGEAAYYTELSDCRDRAIDAGRSFGTFERCAEDADARYGRKDGGK